MVCLRPYGPDEFIQWYKQMGKLRLFWAKPLVELFPLYNVVGGCVLRARWSGEGKLEEAYIAILDRPRKLDMFSSMRGTRLLITPAEVDRGLYDARDSLGIYSVDRPCATGIYLEGSQDAAPDHLAVASDREASRYLLHLNRWSFNIDYLRISTPQAAREALEAAICEARRAGGRYVSVVGSIAPLAEMPRPDFLYNIYRIAF